MTLAKSSCVGGASCAEVSAAEMEVSIAPGGTEVELTQGHVIVWLYRHVLLDLDLVDCLEDGETMSNTVDAHLLELCVL
jgi:hypothetical protein